MCVCVYLFIEIELVIYVPVWDLLVRVVRTHATLSRPGVRRNAIEQISIEVVFTV